MHFWDGVNVWEAQVKGGRLNAYVREGRDSEREERLNKVGRERETVVNVFSREPTHSHDAVYCQYGAW